MALSYYSKANIRLLSLFSAGVVAISLYQNFVPVQNGTDISGSASEPKIIGYVGTVSKNASGDFNVSGWACQKANPQSIKVSLYAGMADGVGTEYFGDADANLASEEAVSSACADSNRHHRYMITLPRAFVDRNAGKQIYVYSKSGETLGPALNNINNLKIPSLFKIVWHLGPKFEDVADAVQSSQKSDLSDLRKLNSLTEGYYFLIISNGILSYWPGRPVDCSTAMDPGQWSNDPSSFLYSPGVTKTTMPDGSVRTTIQVGSHRYSLVDSGVSTDDPNNRFNYQSLNGICKRQYGSYLATTRTDIDPANRSYELSKAAIGRVIQNLNLNNRGSKEVIKELLFSGNVFQYNSQLNQLSLKSDLDDSYKILESFGIHADSIMAYQEPTKQIGSSEISNIPSLARIKSNPSVCAHYSGCIFASLPDDVLGLLKGAFDQFANSLQNLTGFKSPQISTDFRQWNSIRFKDLQQGYTHLKFVTFENGPLGLMATYGGLNSDDAGLASLGNDPLNGLPYTINPTTGQTYQTDMTILENVSVGAAYVLKRASKDVYFLMPNSLSSDQLKCTSYDDCLSKIPSLGSLGYIPGRSVMISEYQNFVKKLDGYLKKYGYSPGVCSPHVHLIPAGYGSKVHTSMLPMRSPNSQGNMDWANTVAGMIGALDELRSTLCQ